MIYLAAPYSHKDPAVRASRYAAATAVAARLLSEGRSVFSPLTLTHPLDLALKRIGRSMDSEYWVAFDEPFMELCSEILVIRLEGWETSLGVEREIAFFESKARNVQYMDIGTLDL